MNQISAIGPDLCQVTDWIFDLDNTLYPRQCNLFAQIDTRITKYVAQITGLETDAARKLQKDYYRDHGTTLNGLIDHHGVDPDHYLELVHDIDYSPVEAHPELVEQIYSLPGRKYIFTNADVEHAQAVLKKLGGSHLFEGIFDIRAAGFKPKPERSAYDDFLAAFDIEASGAAMFDDLEKNLQVPHLLGMATIHVVAGAGFVHEQVDNWELNRMDHCDHIHHVTDDLANFLKSI